MASPIVFLLQKIDGQSFSWTGARVVDRYGGQRQKTEFRWFTSNSQISKQTVRLARQKEPFKNIINNACIQTTSWSKQNYYTRKRSKHLHQFKCLWNEKQVELIWKAFQNEERWCFPFSDIFTRSKDINDLYYADDVTSFASNWCQKTKSVISL